MSIDPVLLERLIRLATAYEEIESLHFAILTADGCWVGRGKQEGRLAAFVNCGDLFYWATADLEPIENEADLELLKTCLELSEECGPSLYCCRRRKMRPQNCVLADIPENIKPMFEACGPPRTNEECG